MFFRREKPHVPTFDELMSQLRDAGFQVGPGPGGKTRATRLGFAADLSEASVAGLVSIDTVGILMGDEIGLLLDLGFQKAWETPSKRRMAALADHLKALHDFNEDLRETLGLKSFYNEGLGTTNDLQLYDRVRGRDSGAAKPWQALVKPSAH
jgi:hypothetical protein